LAPDDLVGEAPSALRFGYETVRVATCSMNKEEIEQAFADAGWQIDGSFADRLLVGHDDDHLSILAHDWVWGTDDPIFELCDHEGEEDITYWVREVTTPERAAELLREYGGPVEEERGNPYKGTRGYAF